MTSRPGARTTATVARVPTARAAVVAVAIAVATLLAISPPAVAGDSQPVAISVSGTAGSGTSLQPGIPCADGGHGANWHYDYAAPLAPGAFSASQSGELRLHLDLHADAATATPLPTYTEGFLAGEASEVVLANPRGSVRLALRAGSGDCSDRPMTFDGTTASGTGTWRVVGTNGAYRETTGTGTFSLGGADVAPGADNPFALDLDGHLDVLDPDLTVTTTGTFWGNLGTDYLSRVVSVGYRFTNTGPGDAFGARITDISSLTNGATPRLDGPLALGDLAAGESVHLTVRHRLEVLAPCTLVILGCTFSTQFTVELPDALDRPATVTDTAAATAPLLPPPL